MMNDRFVSSLKSSARPQIQRRRRSIKFRHWKAVRRPSRFAFFSAPRDFIAWRPQAPLLPNIGVWRVATKAARP
jgi:hypothetical protein